MSHNANQIAFNIIYARALKPTKSLDSEGYCKYRNNTNDCCFVGALIKDEHYNTNLELKTAKNPMVLEAVEASLNISPDSDFLLLAQDLHDYCDTSNWIKELENLAKEYNLTVPSNQTT